MRVEFGSIGQWLSGGFLGAVLSLSVAWYLTRPTTITYMIAKIRRVAALVDDLRVLSSGNSRNHNLAFNFQMLQEPLWNNVFLRSVCAEWSAAKNTDLISHQFPKSMGKPKRAPRLFMIRVTEKIGAVLKDDGLQSQAALLVQLLPVGAVFAPKQTLDVLDLRGLRPCIPAPIPKTFSGTRAKQSAGIVLAMLDKADEILHRRHRRRLNLNLHGASCFRKFQWIGVVSPKL